MERFAKAGWLVVAFSLLLVRPMWYCVPVRPHTVRLNTHTYTPTQHTPHTHMHIHTYTTHPHTHTQHTHTHMALWYMRVHPLTCTQHTHTQQTHDIMVHKCSIHVQYSTFPHTAHTHEYVRTWHYGTYICMYNCTMKLLYWWEGISIRQLLFIDLTPVLTYS